MNLPTNRRTTPTRRPARLLHAGAALLLTAAVWSPADAAPVSASTQDAPHTAEKPTVVLVHGAWADGSSWNGVTAKLQHAGYRVVAPPNPLRGVAFDAETISDYVATIDGPVVLVGHSYGGMVISNVHEDNVQALVYVDAYVPAKGETVFEINAAKPGSCVAGDPTDFLDFVTYPGAKDDDVDAYLRVPAQGAYPGFNACFANGVKKKTAALLASAQRPFAVSAGAEESGKPAWRSTPSWAVVGTKDHVIVPAQQIAMAARAHAHVTKVPAGHLSLVTRPGVVAQTVERASRRSR